MNTNSSPQSPFFAALRAAKAKRSDAGERRQYVYVPYDQLSHHLGPLAVGGRPPENANGWGAVLVENPAKAARRPYHRQKLALVLANQRHFALELEARGIAVHYVVHTGRYADALADVVTTTGPLLMQRPAERELRTDLRPLVEDGRIKSIAHQGWLTRPSDFDDAVGAHKRWRMDAFYRLMRQRSGVLMDARGKPEGGRYSFDGDNREPWPQSPPAPALPTFSPDAITREVVALIEREYAHHPGTLDVDHLPATQADADRLWAWALAECLPTFGPYEDAMSTASRGLFHTRIAPLLNLHRLLPRRVLDDVVALDIPLNSKEGFVRQVLGWREFVHHVHERTDGFRAWTTAGSAPVVVDSAPSSGDGGYARWAGHGFGTTAHDDATHKIGGSLTNTLDVKRPLPVAFWRGANAEDNTAKSGLHCLDDVVEGVWEESYSHHITRLMVLANVAALLDVDPREITDWFWVAYADAYDWVVEPNVLGMGVFAAGDLMTTKPYIAGSGYIQKMSDACGACAFNPKTNCPLRELYWAYFARHHAVLTTIDRMKLPVASFAKRSDALRATDAKIFDWVTSTLDAGQTLTLAGRKAALATP